jgi:hypothetical protein
VHSQERQTRDFGTHARALAEWDRHIFRNRRTLSALETEIKRVAGAQEALERQLSILEVHQREINDALECMEREAEKQYKEDGVREEEAARERDGLFKLAEDVSKQLVDIGAALRETIQMVRHRCPTLRVTCAALTALAHRSAHDAGELASSERGPGGGPAVRSCADPEQPAVVACVDRRTGEEPVAARGGGAGVKPMRERLQRYQVDASRERWERGGTLRTQRNHGCLRARCVRGCVAHLGAQEYY